MKNATHTAAYSTLFQGLVRAVENCPDAEIAGRISEELQRAYDQGRTDAIVNSIYDLSNENLRGVRRALDIVYADRGIS